MNQSNKLCTELLGKYKDFKEIKEKSIVGYKLVDKKNLNYYSIVSGMFRYKTGRIGKSSYTPLYEREGEHLNEHLVNRLAVFTDPSDARDALEKYTEMDSNNHLVVLEIEISGDLETALYTNQCVSEKVVYVGSIIEKIKETEY